MNTITKEIALTPVARFDWEANGMEHRTLTCAFHLDKRWITKHVWDRGLHFIPQHPRERECACSVEDLRVLA